MLFFVVVLVIVATASFVGAARGSEGHGLAGAEVGVGIACLVLAGLLVRLSLTALRVTPAGFEVVNWLRSYHLERSAVVEVVSGDALKGRPGNFALFGMTDDRHFFLITDDGRTIHLAGLALGSTKWGETAVYQWVAQLNALLGHH